MNVLVRTHGLAPDPELFARVQRRLGYALSRFAPRVRFVRVLLADENGPRGGNDKRVRIVVELGRRGRLGRVIVVEDLASDILAAADMATRRAARAVERCIKRPLSRRRGALETHEERG